MVPHGDGQLCAAVADARCGLAAISPSRGCQELVPSRARSEEISSEHGRKRCRIGTQRAQSFLILIILCCLCDSSVSRVTICCGCRAMPTDDGPLSSRARRPSCKEHPRTSLCTHQIVPRPRIKIPVRSLAEQHQRPARSSPRWTPRAGTRMASFSKELVERRRAKSLKRHGDYSPALGVHSTIPDARNSRQQLRPLGRGLCPSLFHESLVMLWIDGRSWAMLLRSISSSPGSAEGLSVHRQTFPRR